MNNIKVPNFEIATYARGDSNSPKLAIVIPGRLDTKDYIHNTSLVDSLANQGIFALSFDPPGTWDSPGDVNDYTTTNYIKVINELIAHYNKPTLLLGHSRGGCVAMLAANNPLVVGVVAIMASYGPPSLPDQNAVDQGYLDEYRDLPPGDTRSVEKVHFKLPINYFTDGSKYNPLNTFPYLKIPKLIIYGDKDEFYEPQEVEEIYQTHAEPKSIHLVHSVHDYRLHPNIVAEVNQNISRWVDNQ